MRQALLATAELRATTYTAYRTRLGTAGTHLPRSFCEVVTAAMMFADPLTQRAPANSTWHAAHRHWHNY